MKMETETETEMKKDNNICGDRDKDRNVDRDKDRNGKRVKDIKRQRKHKAKLRQKRVLLEIETRKRLGVGKEMRKIRCFFFPIKDGATRLGSTGNSNDVPSDECQVTSEKCQMTNIRRQIRQPFSGNAEDEHPLWDKTRWF